MNRTNQTLTEFTITGTAQEILAVNLDTQGPGRKYVLIQNVGANPVFIGFTQAVQAVKIVPGGNYEPLEVHTGEYWAVSTGGDSDCVVIEGIG